MANIGINKFILDKYFHFLDRFDNSSKQRLIIKLTESLEFDKKKSSLSSLFGAWEDSRDSDEIIQDIRDSRVNSHLRLWKRKSQTEIFRQND